MRRERSLSLSTTPALLLQPCFVAWLPKFWCNNGSGCYRGLRIIKSTTCSFLSSVDNANIISASLRVYDCLTIYV